jgi:predicted transcriptional regulator
MLGNIYTVRPDTAVEEVARDLEEAKYGAPVVVLGDEVMGVFTTTDALRVRRTQRCHRARTAPWEKRWSDMARSPA